MTKILTIEGMMCDQCVYHVGKALNNLEGVSAAISLKEKTATLTLEQDVPDEALRAAVAEAGYEVVSISK